jgi:hypothetical protein
MFKDNPWAATTMAARAATGLLAGFCGTYANRVLVRIVEVWPVFHFRSVPPLMTLLGQDWHFMAKASLIFAAIYGIFCALIPRHLVLATVLFMAILVPLGRAYLVDGMELAAIAHDIGWIIFHAAVRAALLLLFYWLFRAFVVSRFVGAY